MGQDHQEQLLPNGTKEEILNVLAKGPDDD